MRRYVVAATLMLTTSMPAMAQNLDALRDALDHLPATLLSQQHGDLAYFADVQVIMKLGDGDAAPLSRSRLMPMAAITALQTLPGSGPTEWEAKAGTAVEKLRYFAGHGRAPNVYSYWGLADEAAAGELIANLQTNGFENAGPEGVVGNGEPMRMDPSKIDPTDPWRTRIGAAQFAAAKGTNVVQANIPQAAQNAAAEQASLGDNPILQTALAGLEQSIGDSQIVQAVAISPMFGMAGLDPVALVGSTPDIDETRQRLEERMAELAQGIPPYLGGLIVDVHQHRPGVGIALAYPDCTAAQAATRALTSRWTEIADDSAQGEIVTSTVQGENGLCAATLSVFVEQDSQENPAYRALIEPYWRGEPGILQIGQS